MRLYRILDGAIIEVADAKASALLSAKDGKGNPIYRQASIDDAAAQNVKAVQTEADTSVGARVGNIANNLAGGASFGLFQDRSVDAERIARANPVDTTIANLVPAFIPGSGEYALAKAADRAFRVAEGASVVRNVGSAVAQVEASQILNNTSTALHGGSWDAILDGTNPLEPGVALTALGVGTATRIANNKVAKRLALKNAAEGAATAEAKVASMVAAGPNKTQAILDAEAAAAGKADDVSKIKARGPAAPDVPKPTGLDKLDTDAYAEIRAKTEVAAKRAGEGKKAKAAIEKQYKQAQEMQANVPIDEAKFARDKAAYDADEAQRVADVQSGKLVADHEAQVAADLAEFQAKRADLYGEYIERTGKNIPGMNKVKGRDGNLLSEKSKIKGPVSPQDAEGFERFLKDSGNGHLTEEAQTMGSLSERFIAKINNLGDNLPEDADGMQRLWNEFLEEEGYVVKGPLPGRGPNTSVAGENKYEGFYPEANLRTLGPDEAGRAFELSDEIGEAGVRKMSIPADKARTLTPARAIKILKNLDPDEAKALLRMMSPEARTQTLMHQAGLLRHADNATLQGHKLRTGAMSERSARFKHELEDAMEQTLKPRNTNEVRVPIKNSRKLTPEDLDPTPRPYPHAPPNQDFTGRVQELGKQYEEVSEAINALDNLRLPKTASSFAKMDSPTFDKMAESVRTLKNHPNPDIASVAEEIEVATHKTLTNMGVDVDTMIESEGDVMGVLNHVRKELRDHPARMAAYQAEVAAQKAVKQAEYASELSGAKAASGAANSDLAAAKKLGSSTYRAELGTAKAELKAAQQTAFVSGGASGGIKQQAAGIFGRYMGSKALMGVAAAMGFSGNGVMSAVSFAVGGAIGGTAGKNLMGSRLLSTQAMIAKAERGMRLAEAYVKISQLGTRAVAATRSSSFDKIFEDKEDDFDAFFPEGERPADDSKAIMQLAMQHASQMADPASAAHRFAGETTMTNPNLAQSAIKTVSAKIHAMATVLPPVPPTGFSSKGGQYPLLHPERIDRIKRVCSVILHPTECLARMIENGRFPQAELDIIRETSPDMFAEAAMGIANELYAEDDEGVSVISKMHPNQQLEFARALGIDSIPGSAPGYIAAMQAQAAKSHQPKPNSMAKPLSSGQGVRAPGPDSTNATESQRSTY